MNVARLKMAASVLAYATTMLVSLNSFAARPQSFCYMPEDSKDVVGFNESEKMPLASVTKVLTSLAVLSTKGVHTKLYTQFYATPVAKDLYDVHIKGSRDPYFARGSMHTLISRLNELGVKNIRTLTFDENFKYLYDTNKVNSPMRGRWYDPVTGKSPIDAPNGDFVRLLLLNKRLVMQDYDKSKKTAALEKTVLVDNPVFNPQKIEQVRSASFKQTKEMKTGYVVSMELIEIIKHMNWNSNNHVANSLFMISGGKEKVENFYYNTLRVNPAELTFVNGSGQNGDLDGSGRAYTEASCSVVVRTLRALKLRLEKENMHLQDALAVGGGDIGSTIDAAVYKKVFQPKTVIAKTGTVGVAITLAGLASTKKGNFFFMGNVQPSDAPGRYRASAANRWRLNEAAKSRSLIGQEVAAEIDSYESGHQLGIDLKGITKYKQRKPKGPTDKRGKAIAYEIHHYDVANFEDDGDENAPELAEADAQSFISKAKSIVSAVVAKVTGGAPATNKTAPVVAANLVSQVKK